MLRRIAFSQNVMIWVGSKKNTLQMKPASPNKVLIASVLTSASTNSRYFAFTVPGCCPKNLVFRPRSRRRSRHISVESPKSLGHSATTAADPGGSQLNQIRPQGDLQSSQNTKNEPQKSFQSSICGVSCSHNMYFGIIKIILKKHSKIYNKVPSRPTVHPFLEPPSGYSLLEQPLVAWNDLLKLGLPRSTCLNKNT